MSNALKSEKFTKRQKITRTATLELVPYAETLDNIKKGKYIESDIALNEKVASFKDYLDKYMADAISDYLDNFVFDYTSLLDENGNIVSNELEELKKAVAKHFKSYKSNKFSFAFDAKWLYEDVPSWLEKNGYEDVAFDLREMKGSMVLFDRYTICYKTALESWIPRRVHENFELYVGNIPLFKRALESGHELFKNYCSDFAYELSCFSTVEGYAFSLMQKEIDVYNQLISGVKAEEGTQKYGFNEIANILNNEIRSKNTDEKFYKKAKKLYKQLFSPSMKAFSISMVTSNDELKDVFFNNMETMSTETENLHDYFKEISNYIETVYVSGSKLRTLSVKVFHDKDFINDKVFNALEAEEAKAEKGKKKKKKEQFDVNSSVFSISQLQQICDKNIVNKLMEISDEIFLKVQKAKDKVYKSDLKSCENIRGDKKKVIVLKTYLESVKEYRDFVEIFVLKDDKDSITSDINEELSDYYELLKNNSKALNMCRNYCTMSLKKETKKYPICFCCPSKYDAQWYKDMRGKLRKQDMGIVRMDGMYYLITNAPTARPISFQYTNDESDVIELCSVIKAQDASKIIPKITFSKEVKNFFETRSDSTYVLKTKMKEPVVICREQYEIYKNGLYKEDVVKKMDDAEERLKINRQKLIALYIKVIKAYTEWEYFDFSDLKKAEDYKNIGEFNSFVNTKTVVMEWKKISRSHFDNLVKDGNLLCFLIKNRNMYQEDRTKTSYAEIFLSIFSDENMENPNVVLNSSPTIYFRPALIDPKVAHPAGSQLVDKRDMDGNFIPTNIRTELYHYFNGRLSDIELSDTAKMMKDKVGHHEAPFDIVWMKRYTEDKFLFTFSYTMNRKIEKESFYSLNSDMKELEEENNGTNLLTVVRGTKHLLYYTLFDKDRNVMESGDLDVIAGVNYYDKLKTLEYERSNKKKEEWEYDLTVSDIKESYLKMASHMIVKKAMDNQAIVLLESASKNSREKWSFLDAQVFGKLEEILTNKFSFYYEKGKEMDECGSILNPLQVSSDKFSGMHKGILVTMSRAYTNIDAESGFVNMFDMKNLNSVTKQRDFLRKFDEIKIEGNKIIYSFNYDNFDLLKYGEQSYSQKKDWKLVGSGARTVYNVQEKAYEYIEDVVKFAYDAIIKADNTYNDGNIVPHLDNLKGKEIGLLLEILKVIMSGVVKEVKEKNNREYFVSPITGKKTYNMYDSRCQILQRKYDYLEEKSKENGSFSFDYNEWFGLFQTT